MSKKQKVAVLGFGAMGSGIAQVCAQASHEVVVLDTSEEQIEAGRQRIQGFLNEGVRREKTTEEDRDAALARVRGTTELGELAGAGVVIEAAVEDLAVKKELLPAVAEAVGEGAILATNTSALSVTEMSAHLRHPERVVGLHFFNPVAQMPLVEVVRTPSTSDAAAATAFAVTKALGKTAVGVADRPGFVVNRLLLRMLAEVAAAVEGGTPVTVADVALRPLGLPMSPFALMQLVGLPVALHVLRTLHEGLGDRYPLSPGLERLAAEGRRVVPEPDGRGAERAVDPAIQPVFGEPGRPGSLDAAGVLDAVVGGLAQEVGLMLDEGVVGSPEAIDLAMILGAGWPIHLGGITPYLDRSGWSQRVLGRRLLPPGVADVPRAPAAASPGGGSAAGDVDARR
jgi:3-hydroxyacyl-CoA dehydrogenase